MYYCKKLKAAYILKQAKKYIDETFEWGLENLADNKTKKIKDLYIQAASFEIISNFKIEDQAETEDGTTPPDQALVYTAQNIVQRGYPTIAPVIVESNYDGEHAAYSESLLENSLLYFNSSYDRRKIENFDQAERALVGDIDGSENGIVAEIIEPVHIAQVSLAFLQLVEAREIPIFGSETCHIQVGAPGEEKATLIGIANAIMLLKNLVKLHYSANLNLAKVEIEFIRDKISDASILKTVNTGLTNEELYWSISDTSKIEDLYIEVRLNSYPPKVEGDIEVNNNRKVILYASVFSLEYQKIKIATQPIHYELDSIIDKEIQLQVKEALKYFLKTIFDKDEFQNKQYELLCSALSYQNVIGVMPTGAGKSIVFQLASMLQPGISIVVEPLVAIIEDQTYNLRRQGIDVVGYIDHSQKNHEKSNSLEKFLNEITQIYYLTPERILMNGFYNLLEKTKLAYMIYDEAHCISQWGHDCRVAYLHQSMVIKPIVKNVCVIAVSGTASSNVIVDIKRELRATENWHVVESDDFRRKELYTLVLHSEKNQFLQDRVEDLLQCFPGYIDCIKNKLRQVSSEYNENTFLKPVKGKYLDAGLVYMLTKKPIYDAFQKYESLTTDTEANAYHGDLNSAQKKVVQHQFIKDKIGLLFATRTFGMGIDKKNIRFTIHYSVPDSIESFYQEAGRAGRDGKPAVNLILAPPLHLSFQRIKEKGLTEFFLNNNFPEKEDMVELMRCLLYYSTFERVTPCDHLKQIILPNISAEYREWGFKINKIWRNQHIELKVGGAIFDVSVSNDENSTICVEHMLTEKPTEKIERLRGQLQDVLNSDKSKSASCWCIRASSEKIYVIKVNARFRDIFLSEKTSQYVVPIQATAAYGFLREVLSKELTEAHANAYGQRLKIDEDLCNLISDANLSLADEEEIKERIELLLVEIYKRGNIEKDRSIIEENVEKYYTLFKQKYAIYLPSYMDEEKREEKCEKIIKARKAILEKLIYYLGVLGVYKHVTTDYYRNVYTLRLTPVTKRSLKKHVVEYMKGYETNDYVRLMTKKKPIFTSQNDDDPEEWIIDAFSYVLDYVYDKIKAHRYAEAETVYNLLKDCSLEDSDLFQESVYQFFEAKYYSEINAYVDNEKPDTASQFIKDKFTECVESGQESILENLAHLRTSSRKVIEERPNNFTPYFLYAYGVFQDRGMNIEDGIEQYIQGVKRLLTIRANYKKALQEFCELTFNMKNDVYGIEDKEFLEEDKGFLTRVYEIAQKYSKDEENEEILGPLIAAVKVVQKQRSKGESLF